MFGKRFEIKQKFKMQFAFKRKINLLLIAIFFSFFVWRDCSLLFQTHVATGIDGYYYVLQVDSIFHTGHLFFPTNAPLVLYFLAVLSFIVGKTIVGIKLGAIFMQVALCLGIACFLQTLTKNIWLAMCGVFLASYSVLHLYFLSEFVSNFGALVLLIWGAFGVVKAIIEKRNSWWLFAGLTLLAACFNHRSAVGLIFSVFSTFCLAKIGVKYAINTRQQLIFGLIVAALFVLPGFLAWQSIIVLPQWVSSEFLKCPQSPLNTFTLREILMIIIVLVGTLMLFLTKPEVIRENLPGTILISIVFWNLLVTLNPFLNHQAGITGIIARLDLLVYLQVAIAFPCLISLILPISKNFGFATIAILMTSFVSNWFAPLPVGLQSEYLQIREKLETALPLMQTQICEKPFIVARHGDQFLITATLNIASQKMPPVWNQFQCVFWLVRQPKADFQFIFENSQASSEGDFVLVENSIMRRDFAMMSTEERRLLTQENSHLRILSNYSTR